VSVERLDLDLFRTRPRAGWVSYALLCIALAYAGDVGYRHYRLTQAVAGKELRLASLGSRVRAMPEKAVDPQAYKLAKETYLRLAIPWPDLFEALEAARSETVVLTEVSPDPEGGRLTISADAKDYLAAISFVSALAEQPVLSRVRLASHELKEGRERDAQRPLTFSVTALWKLPR
jgi:Tfp pilus assembly protein PilN